MTTWLPWAPLIAASLHIFEEFFYPGGFPAWDRIYRPQFQRTIAPRFHIIINGLLLVLCYDAAALRNKPAGAYVWILVMSLLASNGLWHAVGAWGTKRYSPGMITGLVLYVPIAVIGCARYFSSGQISIPLALLALAVGGSYHLWAGTVLHKWSLRRTQA